jgi:hypothetical protein
LTVFFPYYHLSEDEIKRLHLEVSCTLHVEYQRRSLRPLEAIDLQRYPSVVARAYTPEEVRNATYDFLARQLDDKGLAPNGIVL